MILHQNFSVQNCFLWKYFLLEVYPKKKRFILSYSNNRSKGNIKTHLETLSRNSVLYSSSYGNFIVLGDFNVGVEKVNMSNFCSTYDLKTYFKNQKKAIVIGLILINHLLSFLNSCVDEAGLSYFNKIVLRVFKMTYKKPELRVINNKKFII